MAETMSLWLDAIVPPPGSRAAASVAEPESIEITFLDEKGEVVAEPVALALPEPIAVESWSEDGPGWSEVRPPLSLDLNGVGQAVAVRAAAGGTVRDFPLAAVRAGRARRPDAVRHWGATDGWILIVVSEMFGDQDRFFDACDQLFSFITDEAPFTEAGVQSRFGMTGLFWRSGAGGLFNTAETVVRRILGDGRLVRNFVKKARVRGHKVLVLIDSPKRGGAGGVGKEPAWSTITGAQGEEWQAVALHELGHSLGLADEYEATGVGNEPATLEPNVSRARNAAQTGWAALCSPSLFHDPTCAAGAPPSVPAGTVGTFEGARYQQFGRYRPAANCRMRSTAAPFCPVCCAHIRATIAVA